MVAVGSGVSVKKMGIGVALNASNAVQEVISNVIARAQFARSNLHMNWGLLRRSASRNDMAGI